MGQGWLRQHYGFWSGGYLSLFVDGLGFWVGVLGRGFGSVIGWGSGWVVEDLAGVWLDLFGLGFG